ncbi:MAG: hypothetical protein QM751_11100 [Paludibacteraceae bacterium]
MKRIILILVLFVSLQYLNAQAFDGDFDHKFVIGYGNVSGHSGIDVQYGAGLTDYVSAGLRLMYFSVNDSLFSNSIEDDGLKTNFDIGAYLRFHFTDVLNLSSKFDPYLGLGGGLNSADINAGVIYSFNETVGIYGQYSYSFGGGFWGLVREEKSFLYKKSIFSIGLTLSLW